MSSQSLESSRPEKKSSEDGCLDPLLGEGGFAIFDVLSGDVLPYEFCVRGSLGTSALTVVSIDFDVGFGALSDIVFVHLCP